MSLPQQVVTASEGSVAVNFGATRDSIDLHFMLTSQAIWVPKEKRYGFVTTDLLLFPIFVGAGLIDSTTFQTVS